MPEQKDNNSSEPKSWLDQKRAEAFAKGFKSEEKDTLSTSWQNLKAALTGQDKKPKPTQGY